MITYQLNNFFRRFQKLINYAASQICSLRNQGLLLPQFFFASHAIVEWGLIVVFLCLSDYPFL